jgi:hypothetical protein
MLVMSGADRSVYYVFRNTIFWERHIRRRSGFVYYVNAWVFIAIVSALCMVRGRFQRFSVLKRALVDAYVENMGECPAYRLD